MQLCLLALWSLLYLGFLITCHASPAHGPNVVSDAHKTLKSASSILRRWNFEPGGINKYTWARDRRVALERKYGISTHVDLQRRGSGVNLVSNQNADSSYFGSIAVGTPPVSYDVILDTGSSDLWLAADEAHRLIPDGIATFNPNAFKIQYGSGVAEGVLGRDTVQFAGFETQQQAFGVVSNVTDTLLDAPVSGLLGLAFQSISTSGTKPLWQTLVDVPGTLDLPVMAFHLARYVNDSDTRAVEPGGSFSLGSVNSSLYIGEIDYQSVPDGSVGYWVLPMADIDVNGTTVELSADSPSLAAIDTGTTLVGGPSDIVRDIYANIPGSAPGNEQYEGYYTFPCDTNVTVSLRFGDSTKSWPISPADFRLLQLDDDSCLGAFFELSNSSAVHSSGSITWIVGDTFLKNVYSVFRASPPSVGFAELSNVALSMNGAQNPVPTPTLGALVTVTAGVNHASILAAHGLPSILLTLVAVTLQAFGLL